MFETTSVFWYNLATYGLIAVVVLAPLALYLVWRRASFERRVKSLISVVVVALLGGSAFATRSVRNSYTRNLQNQAQYDALEQHRQAQQQAGDAPTSANPTAQPANAQPGNAAAAPTANPAQLQAPTTAAQPGAPPAAASHAPGAVRNYWTDFRGPNRDGVYQEFAVNTNWPAGGLKPLWKQPIGLGWASFVVADGRAFTIEQRRQQEVVTAYDVQTGRELWTHGYNAEFRESMGGDGPRATPTWDAGRVYSLGATGELRVLDASSGRLIWSKNILSDNGAANIQWGMSAAPLIVDDKVVVQPGGKGGKSIVAYNKATGAAVWKTLDDEASYTSPMLVTLAGRRQILTVTASRVVGLAPENGALLWEYPWSNSASINVSQPVPLDSNHVFISAGYGKGAAMFEINGSGPNYSTRTVWENASMKNKFNSSVLLNGHVYGLDEGILTCVEAATGQRKWKGGRYGFGQLLLANGHLIVITEEGELVLVKAAPDKFTEVAKFQALNGRSWNVPVLAGGKLLVRNASEMACFDLLAKN
jgi:outer membrane protein assembly factor BamB